MGNLKERFRSFLSAKDFIYLDGATGTELQKFGLNLSQPAEYWNIEESQFIKEIHLAYLNAGTDIICANTFGASLKKLKSAPYKQAEIISNGLRLAHEAVDESAKEALVAYDMGPLGELMYPSGTFSFKEAYQDFAGQARLAHKYGADLILIETMSDLYELKAAILASKENSDMPIACTMTFQTDGRTFSGTDVETYVNFASAMGVEALGINCSAGPKDLTKIINSLIEHSRIPVILKPNAGMPCPETGQYSLSKEDFAIEMAHFARRGVKLIGGCCGTNTDYIKQLALELDGVSYEKLRSVYRGNASTSAETFYFDGGPYLIGEKISPSRKPKLQAALREANYSYVAKLAVDQERAGSDFIDVNIASPGLDQVEAMEEVVLNLMSVSRRPLFLDSKNPEVLEAGLRAYNGKAVINSLSLRAEELKSILPLAVHYGAAIVLLPIREDDIPMDARARVEVLRELKQKCIQAGLPKEDLIADCLVMALESDPVAAQVCLETISLCKQELELKTLVGLSNISTRLPERAKINAAFLSACLARGLDFAIADPSQEEVQEAFIFHKILKGDLEILQNYASNDQGKKSRAFKISSQDGKTSRGALELAIRSGLEKEVYRLTKELLVIEEGMDLIENLLLPLLDDLGRSYNEGEIFLPQLLQAAQAAQVSLDLIREEVQITDTKAREDQKIIVATVAGDIHDIGKNIAKSILENYGYKLIDLGRNVPPQSILEAVLVNDCKLVGLSALMTSTLPAMEESIRLIKEQAPYCKVMVGGAVLTEEYAYKIGADYYCPDANSDIIYAREVFGQD